MANNIETRIFNVGCSLRADGSGKGISLHGYAAKFGVLSHPIGDGGGSFREKIAKGAFTRALAEKQDVVATIQHDPSRILGRTKSGTLRLAQDDTGLSFRVALDSNNTEHTNLRAGILRGDWDSCSFAFIVPSGGDSWDSGTDENGRQCAIRTLRDVNLKDVSVVQSPAYPQTEVDARSLACYGSLRSADYSTTRLAADFKRARAICAQYPELSYEHVAQCLRLGYDEDQMLLVRGAAIGKLIREGRAR
jgi:HK97 family phage prohead protease